MGTKRYLKMFRSEGSGESMKTIFLTQIQPLLKAITQRMELYLPQEVDGQWVYRLYDPKGLGPNVINNIRACMPVKEFIFPMREIAAVFPEPKQPVDIKPFAVFGLKACDLRALDILDHVFLEQGFEDPLYTARRQAMVIISSDCSDPGESCFCDAVGGHPYVENGFDVNVSEVSHGFIVEAGTDRGVALINGIDKIMVKQVSEDDLDCRRKNRANVISKLEMQNRELHFNRPIKEIMDAACDSSVFEEESESCIECQACTRVCPTCHCFYLYDESRKEYFAKNKMWDSCMRQSYAEVAGGANPRQILGERLRHRLMHKFSYFLERYGIDMCVGCGRCVDGEAGNVDIREVIKKLNRTLTG
jgi:ferredoxin